MKGAIMAARQGQLAINPDILRQHTVILGKTGSGKTYTAKGFVEYLLGEGERVCIVDPTGVWWGLRSKANGKSAAFPVIVFGGPHADMPLLPNQGEAMAEIIGGTDMSAIIDTSEMTVADRTRFFIGFAEGIMRKNKGPLNLFIDEAHNFMPQGKVLSPQAGQMLAAGNELLSGGRARGLRVTLLSQRPQKLHKDALTQCETLVAMRVVHPLDRKAVSEWLECIEGDAEDKKQILLSLPQMPTGTGWVWSPEANFVRKIKFPKIGTYDSSKAPDGSESSVVLAKVDLPTIEKRLGEFAKQAQDNDPKRLRARIAELEKIAQGREGQREGATAVIAQLEKEKQQEYERGHNAGMYEAIENTIKQLEYLSGCTLAISKNASDLTSNIIAMQKKLKGGQMNPGSIKGKPDAVRERPRPQAVEKPPRVLQNIRAARPVNYTGPGEALPLAQKKVLTVLAQYPEGRTKTQLALLTGYAGGGGAFNNALGWLRGRAYLSGGNSDTMRITEAGSEALGPYDPLPMGEELRAQWLSKLGKAERAILEVLCAAYPDSMDKAAVAAAAGYEVSGGAFNNALGKLRTLELASGRQDILAAETLFD